MKGGQGWIRMAEGVLLAVMVCSAVVLGLNLWEYHQGRTSYKELKQELTASQSQSEQPQPWQPDFETLQEKSPETIAWIQMDGLSVDYPILHRPKDNGYYLTHLWDGTENKSGSIFLDGNNTSLEDLHTLVYGHNMRDGSMFAGLKQYLDSEFFTNHQGWMTLYTPQGAWRYQIFSVQIVESDSEVYSTAFEPGDSYAEFVNWLKASSTYNTGVDVSPQDQVLTLSTCTNDGLQRIVVHARRAQALN